MNSNPIVYKGITCRGPLCDPLKLLPFSKQPEAHKGYYLKIQKGEDITKYGWGWHSIPHEPHTSLYPHCEKCLEHLNK